MNGRKWGFDLKELLKQGLSMVIAAIMLAACLVVGEPFQTVAYAANELSVSDFAELKSAMEEADADAVRIAAEATVQMSDADALEIPKGKTLYVDGTLEIETTVNADAITNRGSIVVTGSLKLANSANGAYAAIMNHGTVDITEDAELLIENGGYNNVHGIHGKAGSVTTLSGNVTIANTTGRGIFLEDGRLNIDGDIVIDNTGSRGIQINGSAAEVYMSGGSIEMVNDSSYAIENNGTFWLTGGTIIAKNTGLNGEGGNSGTWTMGLWNRTSNGGVARNAKGLILAGGTIKVENDISMYGFRNDGDIIYLVEKDGVITGDMTYNSGSLVRYGVKLDIRDKEDESPVPNPIVSFISTLSYEGEDYYLLNETMRLRIRATGYDNYDDIHPEITDIGTYIIYMEPKSSPFIDETPVLIEPGESANVEVNVGKGSNRADYIRAVSSNTNVVTVSPERLETDGVMTVTGVGYGNARVTFYMGKNGKETVLFTLYVSISAVSMEAYTVTLTSEGPGAAQEPVIFQAYPGSLIQLEIITVNTYLKEFQIREGGAISIDSNYRFIMPECDVHIHAVFAATGGKDDNPTPSPAPSPGGGSGGGGGGGGLGSSNPSVDGGPNIPTPTAVNSAAAANTVKDAVTKAGNADSVSVVLSNPGDVSLETLKAMAQAASGKKLTINGDTRYSNSSNAVNVRVSLDPSQSTKSVNFFAHTESAQAQATRQTFGRWYSNNLMVVAMNQKGDFGQTVSVAVKPAAGLNVENLVFYSYDKATNTYTKLNNTNYRMDANGYIHFNTSVGGDIIISDGDLVKK